MKNAIVPPAEIAALEDQATGAALTQQYHRAVSGMREVLIFGAMLMQIEAKLVQRGPVSVGGRGNTGGLREFLRENTPEIAHATAMRFLGITRAVAEEYEAIVGTRVAKRFDLPALVLTDKADLPEVAQAKQLELFDYVAGTSQRSWLDAWREKRQVTIGGDTRKIDPATGLRINHTRTPLELQLEARRLTAAGHCKAVCLGLAQLLEERPLGWDLLDADLKQALRETVRDYAAVLKDIKK